MRRAIGLLAVLLALAWVGPSAAQPPTECFAEPTNDPRTSDEADFLTGTDGVDIASLGAGGDQYFAAEFGDAICGDAGNDVVVGETGADRLDGGGNDDVIQGMGGDDVVRGSFGADIVNGGNGDDVIRAGGADGEPDDLFDGPGFDVVTGGAEDTWHKCTDFEPDDPSGFDGEIVPDPDC